MAPAPADAASDTEAAEAANPAGADWTAPPVTPAASAVTDTVTPRRVRFVRSRSKARATRFCAASSLEPKAAPTSFKLRFSK